MIITDSSVIEDLLTAFHYQQQTYSETEKGREEEEEEEERRRGSTEEAPKENDGCDRCWGRLPQQGRVSEGVRRGREMGDVVVVEVVCNSERVRDLERVERKSRVCSNLVCVVLGEAPQHGWI